MTFHHKWGGAWHAVPNGTMKVRWGGQWVSPAYCRIRWGGQWVDTGYRGYPAVPINVGINYWNYDEVRIQWAAGAGGAPVAAWNVVQTDVSGNWLRQYDLGGSPSPPGYFPVSDSTKYRFYVRAKGSSGLYSDWGPSVGASIGKPASTYYTTESATRPWSLAKSVVGYKDAAVGPTVPTDVVVTTIRYQITNGFSGVLSPYGTHSINRWANGGQQEQFSWPSQSIDTTVNMGDYWSNGGVQGMVCRGTGWSTAASGSYVATGTITVNGTETYSYQQAHTIPAVANAYW